MFLGVIIRTKPLFASKRPPLALEQRYRAVFPSKNVSAKAGHWTHSLQLGSLLLYQLSYLMVSWIFQSLDWPNLRKLWQLNAKNELCCNFSPKKSLINVSTSGYTELLKQLTVVGDVSREQFEGNTFCWFFFWSDIRFRTKQGNGQECVGL